MTARGSAKTVTVPDPLPGGGSYTNTYGDFVHAMGAGGATVSALQPRPPVTGQIWPRAAV